MKKAVLVAVLLPLLARTMPAQDVPFFPNHAFRDEPQLNDFIVQWYSKHLVALQEPSLLQQAPAGVHAYRFLWLRTFDHPVAVRVNVNTDGTAVLTVKVTSGYGGYEAGKLVTNESKVLSKQETQKFLDRVAKLRYWDLPSRDPKTGGFDGAQWIVEGIRHGNYKIVDRWTPTKGPVHELGTLLLFDLAKLSLHNERVY